MFIVFKEYKNTLIVQVLTWVDVDIGAVYLRVIANKNPAAVTLCTRAATFSIQKNILVCLM